MTEVGEKYDIFAHNEKVPVLFVTIFAGLCNKKQFKWKSVNIAKKSVILIFKYCTHEINIVLPQWKVYNERILNDNLTTKVKKI